MGRLGALDLDGVGVPGRSWDAVLECWHSNCSLPNLTGATLYFSQLLVCIFISHLAFQIGTSNTNWNIKSHHIFNLCCLRFCHLGIYHFNRLLYLLLRIIICLLHRLLLSRLLLRVMIFAPELSQFKITYINLAKNRCQNCLDKVWILCALEKYITTIHLLHNVLNFSKHREKIASLRKINIAHPYWPVPIF